MLWLKNHPHMIYSLCFVFAVSFLSLFGFVSNSSATSQSFTYDSINNPVSNGQVWNINQIGFNPAVVYITGSYGANNNGYLNTVFSFNTGSYRSGPGQFYYDHNFTILFNWQIISGMYNWVEVSTYYLQSDYSFTMTFYDSLESFKACSCPEPDPCPEVPENPYDDKLDKIYNAIIIGSATMLVIYFFYVMYSWYMGGRS